MQSRANDSNQNSSTAGQQHELSRPEAFSIQSKISALALTTIRRTTLTTYQYRYRKGKIDISLRMTPNDLDYRSNLNQCLGE